MRDLVALSALPAVWMNFQPPQLAASLAEVLHSTLSLDFAYLRLEAEHTDLVIEVVHTDDGAMPASVAATVGQALLQHLESSSSELPNPLGLGTVHFTSVPIIAHGRTGVLVAASQRSDFPTIEQRMLLSISANNAALMLQRHQAEESLREEQAARVRAESLARFAEASRRTLERLATSPDLDAFLDQVMTAAVEQFGAIGGGVWEATDDDGARMIASFEAGELRSPATSQHPALRDAHVLASVLFSAAGRKDINVLDAAKLARDLEKPSFGDYFARYNVRTLIAVPMYLRDIFRGALSLRFSADRVLTPEETELAHTFANQAVLAMELTRLSQAARVAAVSEERNRLARDIHDTLAQSLAAIVRQLESAQSTSPLASARHISLATEIARNSIVDARRSIRALRPPALEGGTLDAAVRDLVQRMGPLSSAKMSFTPIGDYMPIPTEVEDELFRIVHEALTNTIKHAAARVIDVELSFESDSVRVRVRDDGVGFTASRVGRDTVGLHSMRERAQRVGAALTVASELGSGTEVLVYWSASTS